VSLDSALAPCHDAHGVSGDEVAGSGDGFGAVVAPADAAVQAAGQLHARLWRDAAVLGPAAHCLDLALHRLDEGLLAKLQAAFGPLDS